MVRCGEANWLVDADSFAAVKASVADVTHGLCNLDPLCLEYKVGGTYCSVICEESFRHVVKHASRSGDTPAILAATSLRPIVIPATGEEDVLKRKILQAYSTLSSISHRSQSPKKRPSSSSISAALSSARAELEREESQLSSIENNSASVGTIASSDLMVWGTDIGRGFPMPFRPQAPPSYRNLENQIGALLGVSPPLALSFRNEAEGGIDADIEDDGDVQLLAELAARVGIEYLTVSATSRQKSAELQKKKKVLSSVTPKKMESAILASATRPTSAGSSKAKPSQSMVSQLD